MPALLLAQLAQLAQQTKRQSKGRDSFCHLETNSFLYISQAIRIQLFQHNHLFLLKDADEDYIHLNYITYPCQDANNPNWRYFALRSDRYKQFTVSSSEKKTSAKFQRGSKGKERHGAKPVGFFTDIRLIRKKRERNSAGKEINRLLIYRP